MHSGEQGRERGGTHLGTSVSVAPKADGGARVTLIGELDQEAAPDVNRALDAAIGMGSDVELDMRACDFVDSIGIATLVTAARQLHEEDRMLTILGARQRVLRILELTGILTQHWITIVPHEGP
jgi:anti-anti-sigma factor